MVLRTGWTSDLGIMSEGRITSEITGDDIGLFGERINSQAESSEAKIAQLRASVEVAVGEFPRREADNQDSYVMKDQNGIEERILVFT